MPIFDLSDTRPFTQRLSLPHPTNIIPTFSIHMPPKVWRPKPPSRYIPLDYGNEIGDEYFIFKRYGKALAFDPSSRLPPARTDVHLWNAERDQVEFDRNITIPQGLAPDLRQELISIITDYWDCFFEEGVSRPILKYLFVIETGASRPACCRVPQYGIHESPILMEHVDTLLANCMIRECKGPWGSKLLLAPKPHQEHVTDIKKFIWRCCVNYRELNSVTLAFEFPMARCDDSIDNFGDAHGLLYFISVDGKSGFHQISVSPCSQEKLAFFAPDLKKYCYTVMPFGPKNAPAVFTAMMRELQDAWNALFLLQHPKYKDSVISKIIIDDTLLASTDPWKVLKYFRCVCEIFMRYRVSFNPKKCDFFKTRVEWIGHDLCVSGNCPAASKFDLINDWPLPRQAQSLGSFTGLITFYHRYIVMFEQQIKPLRDLEMTYRRGTIPSEKWTPELVKLFNYFKTAITSSPCLA
jgi:hypothetical protein